MQLPIGALITRVSYRARPSGEQLRVVLELEISARDYLGEQTFPSHCSAKLSGHLRHVKT